MKIKWIFNGLTVMIEFEGCGSSREIAQILEHWNCNKTDFSRFSFLSGLSPVSHVSYR